MTCYYKISDISLKLQDGGGGGWGRLRPETECKLSVERFFQFLLIICSFSLIQINMIHLILLSVFEWYLNHCINWEEII